MGNINNGTASMKKGFCQVCDIELEDKRRFYCDEHRDRSAYANQKFGPAGAPEIIDAKSKKTSEKVVSSSPKKAAEELTNLVVPLVFSFINMQWLAPLSVIKDEQMLAQAVDMYSITEQEMNAIAKPLFSIAVNTVPGAKVAKWVLDNRDQAEMLVAISGLIQRRIQMRELVENVKQGYIQVTEREATGEPEPGPPVGGYFGVGTTVF